MSDTEERAQFTHYATTVLNIQPLQLEWDEALR